MALVQIFLHGKLYGTSVTCVTSGWPIGDIIHLTNADILKPMMPQLTGPLIRILGERTSTPTKNGILYALRYHLYFVS